MKTLGQLVFGVAFALGSGLMVIAAISLSLAEGMSVETLPATITPSPTVTLVARVTPAGGLTPAVTQAATVTATPATENLPTRCPPPAGWVPYTVETGDDLETLAQRSSATTEQLQQANCLLSTSLLPGTIVYLPPAAPLPTATNTITPTVEIVASATANAAPCRAPRGWIKYTVQPNDTLFHLSQDFGVSVGELMGANCMTGTLIRAGTRLYVPNVPTRTPQVTETETPTSEPSPTPSVTAEITTPTVEPSPTETATIESSPSPVPGETLEPTTTP